MSNPYRKKAEDWNKCVESLKEIITKLKEMETEYREIGFNLNVRNEEVSFSLTNFNPEYHREYGDDDDINNDYSWNSSSSNC